MRRFFPLKRQFDEKIKGKLCKIADRRDRPRFDPSKASEKSDKNLVRSNVNKEVT